MTKKQRLIMDKMVERMLALKVSNDREVVHCHADDILLEALQELGFGELADAYEDVADIGFWYA